MLGVVGVGSAAVVTLVVASVVPSVLLGVLAALGAGLAAGQAVVIAIGTTGLVGHGDSIQTDLSGQLSHGVSVHAGQRDGNLIAAGGSGRTDGVLQRSSIGAAVAVELNLGHTGALNGDRGTGIQTDGLGVVSHSVGGASLVVGELNTVLLPHLLGGGEGGTLGLVGKGQGRSSFRSENGQGQNAAQQHSHSQNRHDFLHGFHCLVSS